MIRYNHRFVLHPWTITIGSITLRETDEQFIVHCQNQTVNDNLEVLKELLDILEVKKEQQHDFFIQNQQVVNQLITCYNRRIIGLEDHNLSNIESSSERPNIPIRQRNVFGQWIVNPSTSVLNEVD